jgi:hypothetical protein
MDPDENEMDEAEADELLCQHVHDPDLQDCLICGEPRDALMVFWPRLHSYLFAPPEVKRTAAVYAICARCLEADGYLFAQAILRFATYVKSRERYEQVRKEMRNCA